MPIGSVQRTYGLSGSGVDVDEEVKKMMKAKRSTYDKLWQKKTQMEWRKTGYNTIYSLTSDFRNNTLNSFKSSATLDPKLVTSSNDSVVSATATADAANVSHTLAVSQMASGVTLTSNVVAPATGITTGTKYPTTLINQFGMADGDNIDFTINGKNIKLTVTTATTINNVVSAINNSGAGVKANYDETLDRFFLYSNDVGASSKIDFSGSVAGNFLESKLMLDTNNDADGTAIINNGKDAIINLDGVALTQSKNTFSISGVNYTLKAASPKDAANNLIPTTLTVAADIEKTIANVKAFVEDYNTYLSALNKEYTADYNRDYLPLTDDQKSSMKDADITAWQNKAKSGLLRRDPILDTVMQGMRSATMTPVKGVVGEFNTLASIGISTGKYIDSNGNINTESGNGGKLYVDEEKLRNVLKNGLTVTQPNGTQKYIAADPDAVYKIFGNYAPKDNASNGVANRLYQQLDDNLKTLQEKAGIPDKTDTKSTLYNELKVYNDKLNTMQDSLKNAEDMYYKQFNAMETALSKISQQSSWLTQQLSGSK
jgi:flagellar hook-associated protein 2